MPILTDEERIGTIVGNKYRLNKILGRGGMGVVYAGEHTGTGRGVAVKLLLPEYAKDREIARRFVLEARTAGQLSHKSIVEVLDVGRDDADGTVFLVLELLDGEALADVLARHRTLPARVALEMLRPIMDALSVAHAARVVHRDIKPGNIYLCRTREGTIQPKLLDFGLAKVVGSRQSRATRAGSVLGTVEYMSPEQAQGRDDIDWQSDVWSIGVVLYECITGELPFDAKTPAGIVAAILTQPARSMLEMAPNMVPALAKAIDRSLLKDRAERYPSMQAFSEALDGVIPLLPEIPDDDERTKVQWVRKRDGGIGAPVQEAPTSDAFAPPGAATAILFNGEPAPPPVVAPVAQPPKKTRGLVALAAAGVIAAVVGTGVGLRLRNAAIANDAARAAIAASATRAVSSTPSVIVVTAAPTPAASVVVSAAPSVMMIDPSAASALPLMTALPSGMVMVPAASAFAANNPSGGNTQNPVDVRGPRGPRGQTPRVPRPSAAPSASSAASATPPHPRPTAGQAPGIAHEW